MIKIKDHYCAPLRFPKLAQAKKDNHKALMARDGEYARLPTSGAAFREPQLQIVCFSMDRVFQLSEYLRTLHSHLMLHGVTLRDGAFARVAVICRCSTQEIRGYYDALARKYAARVTFLYESERQSFADCLLLSLASGGVSKDDGMMQRAGSDACKYVMFTVDDAFFFDDVELADALSFLDGGARSAETAPDGQQQKPNDVWPFAFHVKLAPSIWRSHLTNKPMLPLPPMHTVVKPRSIDGKATIETQPTTMPFKLAYHVFNPARGCLDWNYPWELSGSVYLHSTVQRVVTEIQAAFGKQGINHPNHLELRGHQIVQKWTATKLECACPLQPKMHVFAINQVQDVFNNRLYEDEVEATGHAGGGDLTNLLRLYQANETLDEVFYRRNRLSSVHIGTLVLKAKESPATASEAPSDLISVVMPVHNVAKYIERALVSIMTQTYKHLEILVIDDASTDATPELVARLQDQDPRIQYVRNDTNVGVAASLNKGFALAKGRYIARMDGDDISLPERIERQWNYLQEHQDVSIVGTSVLLLRERDENSPHSMQRLETAVYPTSPLVTKWRMLFGCFVAHPSVMLRRQVLETLARHGEACYLSSQTTSEDYELWLRCLFHHNLCIQSMGDALLIHRKHASNVSTTRRDHQVEETQTIAARVIQSIMVATNEADSVVGSSSPDLHKLRPLFDVDACESVDMSKHAIEVLQLLQSTVCTMPKALTTKNQTEAFECETEAILQDAASREGQLALKAMLLDPIHGTQLWGAFAARHPQVSRAAFQRLVGK
ncbi:putative Glycosyll transferase family 2, partial [Globisporangium splendens]